MHRVFIAVVISVACAGLARADDVWSTAVAERPSDGWKVIHRFIDKLEDSSEKLAYPVAVTFTLKYDGPNGLPAWPESGSIYQLEDMLEKGVEKKAEGKLALVSTGNNTRTWTYYVKSEAFFRKALADAAEAVHLQLQVSSSADPGWLRLQELRNSVRRP